MGLENILLGSGPLLASLLSTSLPAAVVHSSFDPAALPAQSGRVLLYSLTPRGDVDGVILADGTEVFLPPHLGALLVQTVQPGDPVTVHGLRAHAVPMMLAASITNTATGRTVQEGMTSSAAPELPHGRPREMTVDGIVRMKLHGPRGDLNGVLLGDGTIVRMPPPVAARSGDRLEPGTPVSVRGAGIAGPLGRVVETDGIDPK